MIKILAPARRHPTNRALADFHRYWRESHGPLFANTPKLLRYVQHLTLPEAYGSDPAPTFDGVSMFWYDDLELPRSAPNDPEMAAMIRSVLGIEPAGVQEPGPQDVEAVTLARAVLADDMQLFDRSLTWPMHEKRARVAAEEHVIVDCQALPEMVKAILIVAKLPGLTLSEFFERWEHRHGPIAASLPGLRRYVQNHAVPDAYRSGAQTHDGWSELWFDGLADLRRAVASPEWRAVREDGAHLFAEPAGIGVARECVIKDIGWTYNDWRVGAMYSADIRRQLEDWGYGALAADPDSPRILRNAAERGALAVWTPEHLVTIDQSRIDARPAG
jgi:uncharacterized protein (TIGR02118 family)